MNGFGQDPNYMYSFRQRGYNPQQSTIDAMSGGQDAFRSLRESLAYSQAGMEGKQRMERVVSMGLPANTDINKIQRVGYDPEMRRPVYVAPRPQAWGTYGSIGMDKEERPVAIKPPPPPPPPPDAPAPPPTEIKKTELGESGAPIAFTPFGERVRQESQPQPKAGSPFPAGTVGSLTGFGGIPRFPYANY